ncbi:MAG: hypothetical protein K2P93_06290 [Alphaproteobacteria bacterium]|nr:hypothetical protein [Alphaproteobacteria bacterium]
MALSLREYVLGKTFFRIYKFLKILNKTKRDCMRKLLKKSLLFSSTYLCLVFTIEAQNCPISDQVTKMYFALNNEYYAKCGVYRESCFIIGTNESLYPVIGRGKSTNKKINNALLTGKFELWQPVCPGTKLYIGVDETCFHGISPDFEGEGTAIQDGVIWGTCRTVLKIDNAIFKPPSSEK